MSLVVVVTGSPSDASRTQALAAEVTAVIAARGFTVESINVRELPAAELLLGRADAPGLRHALDLVERADGVVILTPIYKAAYSGVLKLFLDVLPQFGLRGKVVLPLATGGSLAHVLALDYALRPVLQSLGAEHVVAGLFLLDKLLTWRPGGGLEISPEIGARLDATLGDFLASMHRLGRG